MTERPPERDPMEGRGLVTVGEVVAPFGRRGEIKVYPHTDFPDRLVAMRSVVLEDSHGGQKVLAVLRARLHKNVVVMELEGVVTVEGAEALRGSRVVIEPDARHPLPEDTFYVDDLVGMQVVTDEGRRLGPVRRVLSGPANDVYDLGDLLIPVVRDVVVHVDLRERVIVIHPIAGLLDEPETA